MKVKATKEYVENKIKDSELNRIPEEGEVFEVSKERFDILNGNNSYGLVFVKKLAERKVKEKEE